MPGHSKVLYEAEAGRHTPLPPFWLERGAQKPQTCRAWLARLQDSQLLRGRTPETTHGTTLWAQPAPEEHRARIFAGKALCKNVVASAVIRVLCALKSTQVILDSAVEGVRHCHNARGVDWGPNCGEVSFLCSSAKKRRGNFGLEASLMHDLSLQVLVSSEAL